MKARLPKVSEKKNTTQGLHFLLSTSLQGFGYIREKYLQFHNKTEFYHSLLIAVVTINNMQAMQLISAWCIPVLLMWDFPAVELLA